MSKLGKLNAGTMLQTQASLGGQPHAVWRILTQWHALLSLTLLTGLLSYIGNLDEPLVEGIQNGTVQAGVLTVVVVFFWALGVFQEPTTTLVFFLLAVILGIATPSVVFSGFQSPAWWLVFAGSITGIAVKVSGLGDRLATCVFTKFASSYTGYVAAVAFASVALGFFMPSTTGRILLLIPMVLALCERLGLDAESNGRTGLILTAAAASYMPTASILPANIPNGVLLGTADSLYGISIQYGSYLLLHFPVLGLLKTSLLVFLVVKLFPENVVRPVVAIESAGRVTKREKALSIVLLSSLILFCTDALHHISPAWISLAAAIICLLPTTGIISAKELNERMHITPLIYVAGFLGLGAVMVETGVGALISTELLALAGMAPQERDTNILIVSLLYAAIGLVTTLPALPAILTPLAESFSQASGLSMNAILMLQVPVFSTVFLPYQSPPMIIAMHLGGVSLRAGTKLCVVLALLTVMLLLPLDYAWWRLLDIS